MNLLEEIRHGFANLSGQGGMLKIDGLDANHEAWIFREDGIFGVAVEIDDSHIISEKFAGSRLTTVNRVMEGMERHLLRLECSVASLRNEFAVVCAQMATPGEDGELRKSLLADPSQWWERWRQLLGNAVSNKNAYCVLGELLSLERLILKGEQTEWLGPKAGTIDLDTPIAAYEVKSTLSRYESTVHIAGQFQLAGFQKKKLYLVHCRFEPSLTGDSINKVIERLVAYGENREEFENLLSRCGFESGSSIRAESYKLIETKLYEVNEHFPKLTQLSFANGIIPPGILKIEYEVDLTGLAYSEI